MSILHSINPIILESATIAVICSASRLLFIPAKTLAEGRKIFLGGILIGSLIGYLISLVPDKSAHYTYTSHIWQAYSAGFGLFGKEMIVLFHTLVIDGGTTLVVGIVGYIKRRIDRIGTVINQLDNYKDGNDNTNNK